MKARSGLHGLKRLAFGPAMLALLMASTSYAQDTASMRAVHSKVTGAEAKVAKALKAGDSNALSNIGMGLGSIIEAAFARRDNGEAVSSCDMAAHSLAFVAVSAADALISKGEARMLLMEDAKAAASDFQKDMQACDRQVGKSSAGGHTGVGKALRAL